MTNTMDLNTFSAGLTFDLNASLGLIRASGADAHSFLHSQLTQDVLKLGENDVRLAGYCSAKGRMYAMFYIWADGETVYLLTQRSVMETVLKRLRMFVLRAKVVLEDVSEQYVISGYVGADALVQQTRVNEGDTVRLGILHTVISEANTTLLREIRISTVPLNTDSDNIELWQWLDIRAGIAHVTTEISEAFVPQMMNLDRIGGVNFKKGCYPGQEIVARSHYLGKLKRRMQAASIGFTNAAERDKAVTQLRIGMDVYASTDPAQPAGQLLAYARSPLNDTQMDVLYEVSLPLLENDAQLSLKDLTAPWQRRELPYLLSDPA